MLSGKGLPLGAVVVRDGQIVGEGANAVTATNDPTAHAGRSLPSGPRPGVSNAFTLSGCELYTSCDPCPMCLAAAYWARVDAIYYGALSADAARAGFDDAFLYEELRKTRELRGIPSDQLLGDEARASFDAWLASPHRVAY